MSSKIDLSLVAAALKTHKVPPPDIRAILEDLSAQVAPESGDEPTPRAKNQFVCLSNPEGTFGWVFQMPFDASPTTLLDRIHRAAHAFNASKRGRLIPVVSISETLAGVPRKFFKDAGDGLVLKNKEPVALIRLTQGKLPEAPTA